MKHALLFLLITCFSQFARSQSNDTLSLQSAVDNIYAQSLIFPQEKIYVQTDKPYYVSGEKLFFRAFLLEAMSNLPSVLSRYVYVELINPIDSVIIRQQIRTENTMFYGSLLLPEYLPQGDYRLRAYTRFMKNSGEEYFYSRSVYITDPSCIDTQLDAEFTFLEKNKVGVNLRFSNRKTNVTFSPDHVLFQLKRENMKTYKPDGKGTIDLKLDVPEQERILLIESITDNKRFGQYLRIPHKKEGKFAVKFYPEGGYLIPGKSNRLAFKAELPTGNKIEIKGEILDKEGNTVADFSTQHEDMGSFIFQPEGNETYKAVCRYGSDTVQVVLPQANSEAKAIAAHWNRDRLYIKVNKSDNQPEETLYLISHNKGLVIYSGEWDWTKEYVIFDKKDFPSGVSHLLLLNEHFDVLSERLFFGNNAEDYLGVAIQTNRKKYNKREKVEMNIGVSDILFSDSIITSFAVSVTNDQDVLIDTTTNIVAEILLASELKGSVSNPAYYFQQGKPEIDADLLMLTQAWNRYSIPDAIHGRFNVPKIFPETFQSFSGTVKGGILQKPYKGANVTISTDTYNIIDAVETDATGRFRVENFEFPDSTDFLIQAFTPKGSDKLDLYVDSIFYPEVSFWKQSGENRAIYLPDNLTEYVSKSDWKYTIENGMRMVNLPEIIIKAERKQEKKFKTHYGLEPDNYLSEEFFEHYGGPDILYALARIPGVFVQGGAVSFVRMGYKSIAQSVPPPGFIVDGILMNRWNSETAQDYCYRILSNINPADVVQVNALQSAAKLSLYDPRFSAGGVFEIYTKNSLLNKKIQALQKFNFKVIQPLGYQLPVEFYSPQYETSDVLNDKNPDLRSTIYWKPNVITDSEGKSVLSFYTADTPSTYSAIIEGITGDGKLIYQRKSGMVEVE
jgi:hypothetical protein